MQLTNISRSEFLTIQSECRSAFNWNDFGYWQGNGQAPDCRTTLVKSKSASLTINWPTFESVEKWHSVKDKEVRNSGYLINVLIGLVSLYTGAGAASLVLSVKLKGAFASAAVLSIDTATDITKGELLSKLPRVMPRPGDKMVIEFTFQVREYAQAWQNSTFVVSSKSTHYHADGTVVSGPGTKTKPTTVTYGGDNFPMELAHKIIESRMANHVVYF